MVAEIFQFRSDFPSSPKDLGPHGKAQWAKGRELWNTGVLTELDIVAWKMFCEAFDELSHCDEVLAAKGEYQLSSQGTYSEHPALRRKRATEQKILRYQKIFGLIPDARKKKPSVQQGVATRKR
jgi:P27 family predicted phage terminase small subunit